MVNNIWAVIFVNIDTDITNNICALRGHHRWLTGYRRSGRKAFMVFTSTVPGSQVIHL